jgi:hypothetical protein
VRSTYADFLHDYSRIAVAAYRYLFLAKANQKNGVFFIILLFLLNTLEDRIGRIGRIIQVEQQVLTSLVIKLRMVADLTNLTLRFLIGVEESVIVLALDHVIGNPIPQTHEMGVLNRTRTLTQTHERIVLFIGVVETNSALVLITGVA